jgi:hypothetical protein
MRYFNGRGDWIRTSGLYVPNVALYQAEPHLDGCGRRIRTLTNRVRVCCATFTQFRNDLLLTGTARLIIPNSVDLSIPLRENFNFSMVFRLISRGNTLLSGYIGFSMPQTASLARPAGSAPPPPERPCGSGTCPFRARS